MARLTGGQKIGKSLLGFSMSALAGQGADFLAATAEPWKHAVAQSAWAGKPVITPDAPTIISLWNRGLLSLEDCINISRMCGVAFRPDLLGKEPNKWMKAWNGVAQAAKEIPSPDAFVQAWQRGLINNDNLAPRIARAGGDYDLWMEVSPMLLDRPDADQFTQAYLSGMIDQKTYRHWLTLLGCDITSYEDIFDSMRSAPNADMLTAMMSRGRLTQDEYRSMMQRAVGDFEAWSKVEKAYEIVPSIGELLECRNRGYYTDQQVIDKMVNMGYGDDADRRALYQLRNKIPGPSDLIHMVVKEAFSVDIANKLGLYDEYPTAVEPWFEKQGLLYPVIPGIISDGQARNGTWLDALWAAHWQPISASQAYRMSHLLRPGTEEKWQARGIKFTPFTDNDVKNWLRINDYPPAIRESLAAIAYTPIRLWDIRTAVRLGLKDEDWAVGAFMDRGHYTDDAQLLAKLTVEQSNEKLRAPLERLKGRTVLATINQILRMYRAGAIDKQMCIGQLGGTGLDDSTAKTMTENLDTEIELDFADQVVRRLKRDYLSGVVNEQECIVLLKRAGINDTRTVQYVRNWNLDRTRARRTATSAQILRWLKDGLLDQQTAASRLHNLGWSDVDTVMQLAQVQGDINQRNARLTAAQEKKREQQAKELERQMIANQKEQARLNRAAHKIAPRSSLIAWLAKRIITRKRFRLLMKGLGYDLPDVRRYEKEALDRRQAARHSGTQASTTSGQTAVNPPVV